MMSREADLKALLDMEAELELDAAEIVDDLIIHNELDWLLMTAEMSWDPWFYYKDGNC